MTQPTPSPEAPATLDELVVAMTPERIVETLEVQARRGKMPGFQACAKGRGELFLFTDFGTPFESVLSARATDAGGGVTKLSWRVAMKPRLPIVYLAVLVFTVWPGVWLTDSMIRTYWTGYDYSTWMWYLPLTAPFVPWAMWSSIKKSRASARAEAAELVRQVGAALGINNG